MRYASIGILLAAIAGAQPMESASLDGGLIYHVESGTLNLPSRAVVSVGEGYWLDKQPGELVAQQLTAQEAEINYLAAKSNRLTVVAVALAVLSVIAAYAGFMVGSSSK